MICEAMVSEGITSFAMTLLTMSRSVMTPTGFPFFRTQITKMHLEGATRPQMSGNRSKNMFFGPTHSVGGPINSVIINSETTLEELSNKLSLTF